MQLVQLQGDASISALVQRVYGLAPGSAGAQAAQAALLAANPHLSTIATLPANTPVVLPPGTPAGAALSTTAVSADPQGAAMRSTLATLAAAIPLRGATGAQPGATQQAAITALQADLAAFAKLHGG